MNETLRQFIVLVSISGVLNTCLGLYAFLQKNDFSGMKAFGWMCFLSAIYTFAFGMELLAYTLPEIKLWIKVEYLAMPFIAPVNLVLILHYLGLDAWLTRKRLLLLLAIPAMTTLMVWTNGAHHLFYRSIYMRPGEMKPLVDIVMGEWYVVHGCFTFGCMVASVWLLLNKLIRVKRHTYRIQVLTLLIGLLLPMAGALLYLLERTPYGMDPVPITMSFTSALYIATIFSSGMLRVLPIAREAVFESMRDGVLVLAPSGQIVDYNKAAARMLTGIGPAAIGRPFSQYWPQSVETDCAFLLGDHPDGESGRELQWPVPGGAVYYHFRSARVVKPGGAPAGQMITVIDITERMLLQHQLLHLASMDYLTQIANRKAFIDDSRKLLAQALAAGTAISFILFDIDSFKKINDQYGHDAGDTAIRHVVRVTQGLIAPQDRFGRYGGEEFILCLPGVALVEAGEQAERIRLALCAHPLLLGNEALVLTASFGVAAPDTPGMTLEKLIARADQAMYLSKHNGRNQVQLASFSVGI
jgi:diguanylate cyclase (GGDEF)-like protein